MSASVILLPCSERLTDFRKLSSVQMQSTQLCWSDLWVHLE